MQVYFIEEYYLRQMCCLNLVLRMRLFSRVPAHTRLELINSGLKAALYSNPRHGPIAGSNPITEERTASQNTAALAAAA